MKCICIHGHFYQPPRENPYTEKISLQESAHPFHDWNERISFECYGPNAFSRLLNDKSNIIGIINNYRYISFNFGPTLMSWLKTNNMTHIYDAIVDADIKGQEDNNGHGSAIAQVYNHIIMPLANREDKDIQVKWGIQDFYSHFKRMPEGMWLAETAVDTETLEVLADNNIRYTILSPYQAKAIKEAHYEHYAPVNIGTLNIKKPYKVLLPSGKEIIVFFYNGQIAQDLSFGNMLTDGEAFYQKLKSQFDFNSSDTELVNVALDGETFGHHHKHGDMALAYCVNRINKDDQVHLVNYGRFLDLYNVTAYAEIHDNTAWSCSHGIERWRSNCGCKTYFEGNWNQEWRKPLREALNYLNLKATEAFYDITKNYFANPIEVLHHYIDVILQRSEQFTIHFFKKYTKKVIKEKDLILLARAFEMKRNCQLMFTSCGWFFNDISGIETVQILMFADRVLQIYSAVLNKDLTTEFLHILESAKSNVPEYHNGEWIYKNFVRPNRQDLSNIAMIQVFHYLNQGAFAELEEQNTKVEIQNVDIAEMGYLKILVGDFKLQSKVTYSSKFFYFVVFQLGRANFIGYYNFLNSPSDNPAIQAELIQKTNIHNIPELLETAKKIYKKSFTLNNILREDQALILNKIAQKEISHIASTYQDIYLRNYPLSDQFLLSNTKLPAHLWSNMQIVLNDQLLKELTHNPLDVKRINKIADEMNKWKIDLTREMGEIKLKCSYLFRRLLSELNGHIDHADKIETIYEFVLILQKLNINPTLWNSQNKFFNTLIQHKDTFQKIKSENVYLYDLYNSVARFLKIDLNYVVEQ